MTSLIPRPRTAATSGARRHRPGPYAAHRRFYRRLGWPVTGEPPELVAGVHFDALRMPAAAGLPLLARPPRVAAVGGTAGPPPHTGPALRAGADLWLLIAAGAAAEVPGLLHWLEWGTLAGELGLVPVGAGGRLPAPAPPGRARSAGGPTGGPAASAGRTVHGPREAAVWLRPPVPGGESTRLLPSLVLGGHGPHGPAPDLVRLLDAAAAECHRARLRRPRTAAADRTAAAAATATAVPPDQALAFS